MTLAVDVRHVQGAFTLEAAFESSGRLTALFGPSGSGKTTLVNLIGGLVRPQRGRIVASGRVLVDTSARTFLPPHRRRVGYVFQDARLFPHLTVAQNLRFGRFFTPRGERYANFDAVVEMLGIGPLLARRPAGLSGGERQRVAIGRALVASPALLLMDEPLASLDEARKDEILPYVERLRDDAGIPIVYVSHSLGEVSRLATDIVRLAAGRVVDAGPAASVLTGIGRGVAPGSDGGPFAVLELDVLAREPDGLAVLRSSAAEWRLADPGLPLGARLRAKVEASDVIIALEAPRGLSALNIVPVTVAAIVADAEGKPLVELASGTDRLLASITARSVDQLGLAVGRPVFAVVKSVAVDSLRMPAVSA